MFRTANSAPRMPPFLSFYPLLTPSNVAIVSSPQRLLTRKNEQAQVAPRHDPREAISQHDAARVALKDEERHGSIVSFPFALGVVRLFFVFVLLLVCVGERVGAGRRHELHLVGR